MPTRLVEVQVKEAKYVLKLVEGISPQKYVTLSHCWGKNMKPTAKTMISTLHENKINIPWENLTQTFRDAVAMTERLGYRYIWIDSLCIVQDKKEDWEAESAQIGMVYENCDLMLSADASPDSKTQVPIVRRDDNPSHMQQDQGSGPKHNSIDQSPKQNPCPQG